MHKKKNLKHCGDSSKNDANMKSNEKGFTLDLLKKNMGITTVHSPQSDSSAGMSQPNVINKF